MVQGNALCRLLVRAGAVRRLLALCAAPSSLVQVIIVIIIIIIIIRTIVIIFVTFGSKSSFDQLRFEWLAFVLLAASAVSSRESGLTFLTIGVTA